MGTETGPDEFEIHISDGECEFAENDYSQRHTENSVHAINEPDLLRASLTDVVLTQSLQFSEKKIDFEDEDEFSAVFTELGQIKPDLLLGASPSMSQNLPPVADLTEQSASLSDDIATDFEDAIDPPLFTSTLKAADADSDDEFDFDLPAAKGEKGKSVRFSGEFNIEEPALERKEEQTEKEESGLNELSGQMGVGTVLPIPPVAEKEDVKIVISDIKLEGAGAPGVDVVKPEEDEEKEDRSHIITSSAADWDNVQTVEAGFNDGQASEGAEFMSSVPPLLSFSDLWQYFRSMDHSDVKGKIQVTVEKKGFAGIISRLFGPPKLHKDLHSDRELVFCIAATAFDNGEEQHVQSLQTIYRVLTGSRFNSPRFGSHWEEIGFQGRDPATDLRGTGMLALVQLVSFLQDDTTAQLARDLYKLSLHPTQNFPFCVMCINISRITLQALREGILNRECNSQRKVMSVVNQFYAGTLLNLYRVWRQGKTISDSGFVIRDIETRAKKQPREIFRDLQTYITSQKDSTENQAAGSRNKGSDNEGNMNFFNVVKGDSKCAAELY